MLISYQITPNQLSDNELKNIYDMFIKNKLCKIRINGTKNGNRWFMQMDHPIFLAVKSEIEARSKAPDIISRIANLRPMDL